LESAGFKLLLGFVFSLPYLGLGIKSSRMLHCVTEYIVPDVSKDHSAFIFRVKQSKKSTHTGRYSVLCWCG